MQDAVERVIKSMWDRYNEPLTLAELADIAILSRFYFSRVFRMVTGTSPCRFLTAIRLYKAKTLLLETSLSVTDISYKVCYNSLGTFTSRFTRSVGISPARYRYMSRVGIPPMLFTGPIQGHRFGTVHGSLNVPSSNAPTRVYIGTFDSPIAQGMPTACTIVDADDSYRLTAVPDGDWFIQAAAVATRDGDVDPRPWNRKPLFVASRQLVKVRTGGSVRIDLDLHPMGPIDLPILLALPELDSRDLPTRLPVPQAAR